VARNNLFNKGVAAEAEGCKVVAASAISDPVHALRATHQKIPLQGNYCGSSERRLSSCRIFDGPGNWGKALSVFS
jgi:hypothetical protein